MALELIVDNLRDGYNRLQPGTFLHADQLTAEQVRNPDLRNQSYYVADGPLYSLEGKERIPTLWLTREKDNLVLRHLNDKVGSSYEQLIKTKNFRPHPGEARDAMSARGTLGVNLTKLNLQGDNSEWRYLEISTTGYDGLNTEGRKLAERFYGPGKLFKTAMKTLNDAGIPVTRVYVLAPEYVRDEAKQGPIGRAAWRVNFNNGADSYASVYGVYDHSGLRGVRRIVAPKGRAKKKEVPSALQEVIPPSREELLKYCHPFVADAVRIQFESGLIEKFYKR